MDFLPKEIDAYALAHSSEEPEYLKVITRDTYAHVLYPRMLSGHLQGRILSMLSFMIRPKHVLEIGTFTGYSALCFAEGLAEKGKVTTIDINEELETRVRGNFALSPFADKIDYQIGNALEVIPGIEGEFDLVFIDADKVNYTAYFDLIIDRMSPNGIIIVDNVLWSGKVAEEKTPEGDKDTLALKAFNDYVAKDDRVASLLLPVRDGLMLLRKK